MGSVVLSVLWWNQPRDLGKPKLETVQIVKSQAASKICQKLWKHLYASSRHGKSQPTVALDLLWLSTSSMNVTVTWLTFIYIYIITLNYSKYTYNKLIWPMNIEQFCFGSPHFTGLFSSEPRGMDLPMDTLQISRREAAKQATRRILWQVWSNGITWYESLVHRVVRDPCRYGITWYNNLYLYDVRFGV